METKEKKVIVGQMNLRMSRELIDRFKILAIKHNVSLSLYIQRLLMRHLEEVKKYE